MKGPREYEAEGIRVRYDVARCIHARECVRGLASVFDPGRRPWIDPSAAPPEQIAATIRRCPTGALTYRRTDGGPPEEPPERNEIRVGADGPLYASGRLVLLDAERRELGREVRAALCRCGASSHKPFCDGSHAEIPFREPGRLGTANLRGTDRGDGEELRIRLRADGPLVLEGPFEIRGGTEEAMSGAVSALCRCGASRNKPFCDGSHRDLGFRPEDPSAS